MRSGSVSATRRQLARGRGRRAGVLYERALRRSLEESGVAIAEVRCPVEVAVDDAPPAQSGSAS